MLKGAISGASADLPKNFEQAGLSKDISEDWLTSRPELTGDFKRDVASFSRFWRISNNLLNSLPKKPARDAHGARAAETLH